MFTCIGKACYHIRKKGGYYVPRIHKGEKDRLKDIASQVGLSLNAFIDTAVKEKIEKEGL